jgi:hypothetical protein
VFFLYPRDRFGCVIKATSRLLCPRETEQRDGWAPGQVRAGAEDLAAMGIGSPDRPARTASLLRLRYVMKVN